jgi:hypothetical protein
MVEAFFFSNGKYFYEAYVLHSKVNSIVIIIGIVTT